MHAEEFDKTLHRDDLLARIEGLASAPSKSSFSE
jgi:hypothetical protein